MNVSLPPELEEYVAAKVASGSYPSADDVIRDGLLALREKEEYQQKRAALIADVEAGLASLDAGQGIRTTAREILDDLRKRRKAE